MRLTLVAHAKINLTLEALARRGDGYHEIASVLQTIDLRLFVVKMTHNQRADPEAIDKAIRAADLGLNPINDGKMLKIPIPPLDEERRKEIVKRIKKMTEDEKTVLRNYRRDAKEMIEELEKEKEITEDDKFWGYDKLKEITDEYSGKIEEMTKVKEKEILEL